ncbi:YaaL family protein [Metabacillus sp. KIGAM252]|uniref:YaaL family protein n=1 Tax=Metabacillus flavus TaxID=2823519 RepID=A0ABS5L930_9BACI|nr:YaaL family protein [Metabacillus flavus]MBS2967239.1 YaaL family protein [Metabacillus flavus]
MLFKRKGRLRQDFNQQLIDLLMKNKSEWNRQKQLVEKSVEPSEEVLFDLKVAESKYFFLLREAKQRKIRINL